MFSRTQIMESKKWESVQREDTVANNQARTQWRIENINLCVKKNNS